MCMCSTKLVWTTCMRVQLTVKRESSFQQAICYLSFRWLNIWTVNCVNRLAKNPKHSLQQSPLHARKPNHYHLHHKQLVKNAKITHMHHKCQSTCLWCRWVNVRLGIAVMCFGFLICSHNLLSMHVICSLTWNSDNRWLVEMTSPCMLYLRYTCRLIVDRSEFRNIDKWANWPVCWKCTARLWV